MRIIIPQNIFSAVFALSLPVELQASIMSKPSSMIAGELENGIADIALLPSCDLIKHNELFVSGEFAISFSGELSNAYIYFKNGENNFEEIFIKGDVSTNEVILTKLLFAERFNTNVQISIDTAELQMNSKNYLLVGNDNIFNNFPYKGISYAELISDVLNFPYVNFVFVGQTKDILDRFHDSIFEIEEKINRKYEFDIEKINLKDEIHEYVVTNFSSVLYRLTEDAKTGLNELMKLPFYHGLITELHDINFVFGDKKEE